MSKSNTYIKFGLVGAICVVIVIIAALFQRYQQNYSIISQISGFTPEIRDQKVFTAALKDEGFEQGNTVDMSFFTNGEVKEVTPSKVIYYITDKEQPYFKVTDKDKQVFSSFTASYQADEKALKVYLQIAKSSSVANYSPETLLTLSERDILKASGLLSMSKDLKKTELTTQKVSESLKRTSQKQVNRAPFFLKIPKKISLIPEVYASNCQGMYACGTMQLYCDNATSTLCSTSSDCPLRGNCSLSKCTGGGADKGCSTIADANCGFTDLCGVSGMCLIAGGNACYLPAQPTSPPAPTPTPCSRINDPSYAQCGCTAGGSSFPGDYAGTVQPYHSSCGGSTQFECQGYSQCQYGCSGGACNGVPPTAVPTNAPTALPATPTPACAVGANKGSYCDTWTGPSQFCVQVSYGNSCQDVFTPGGSCCGALPTNPPFRPPGGCGASCSLNVDCSTNWCNGGRCDGAECRPPCYTSNRCDQFKISEQAAVTNNWGTSSDVGVGNSFANAVPTYAWKGPTPIWISGGTSGICGADLGGYYDISYTASPFVTPAPASYSRVHTGSKDFSMYSSYGTHDQYAQDTITNLINQNYTVYVSGQGRGDHGDSLPCYIKIIPAASPTPTPIVNCNVTFDAAITYAGTRSNGLYTMPVYNAVTGKNYSNAIHVTGSKTYWNNVGNTTSLNYTIYRSLTSSQTWANPDAIFSPQSALTTQLNTSLNTTSMPTGTDYFIVCNADDGTTKCTGNPFMSLPSSGWQDCSRGTQSRAYLTMVTPSPTPYPTIFVQGEYEEDMGSGITNSCNANFPVQNTSQFNMQLIPAVATGFSSTCTNNVTVNGNPGYTCTAAIDNQHTVGFDGSQTLTMQSSYTNSGYGPISWRTGNACSATTDNTLPVDVTVPAPITTFTRNLYFKYNWTSWFKTNGSSFISHIGGSNIIPHNIAPFDGTDLNGTYMLDGVGGSLLSPNGYFLGYNGATYSLNNWYANNYTSTLSLSPTKYIDYLKSRRLYNTVESINDLKDAEKMKANGSYVIQSDLTFSDANMPTFNGKDVVIVSDHDVTITNNQFNPASNVAIIAKKITIAGNTTLVKAILVAQQIVIEDSTPQNDLGLKVIGNLISQTQGTNSRTRTYNNKPALYVEMSPAMYLALYPYLSINVYEYRQIQ